MNHELEEEGSKKGVMQTDPRAGQPADTSMLVDVPRLMTAYYTRRPDVTVAEQRVTFGTSGHRGSAFDCAFNEDHILAITQANCEYRRGQGVDGPLFLGIDTHALSASTFASALEVLAAYEIEVRIDDREARKIGRNSHRQGQRRGQLSRHRNPPGRLALRRIIDIAIKSTAIPGYHEAFGSVMMPLQSAVCVRSRPMGVAPRRGPRGQRKQMGLFDPPDH